MGPAIAAVGRLGVALCQERGASLAVGGLAVGLAALVFGGVTLIDNWTIPTFGGESGPPLWLVPFLLWTLGVGAMYAVVTVDRLPAVGGLLRGRLLSLLGVGFLTGALFQVAWVCSVLAGVVLLLTVGLEVESGLSIGALELFGVLIGLLFWSVAVVGAAWFQLVLPAVVVDERSAPAALDVVLGIVRSSPVSTAGFTLLRMTVQYGPVVLTVAGAWLAQRVGPVEAPAFRGALTDIDLFSPSVFPLVAAGLVVGQVLRVHYTVEFYRLVSADRSTGDGDSGDSERAGGDIPNRPTR